MRRVVYVTYDGLTDPLGESQVLPYVRGLAAKGHRFEIVSFEKRPAALRFRERIGDGIRWTALRYHKTPTVPATAFDMTQGLAAAAMKSLVARADLVHVRSLVPGAMALPWTIASRTPLLFDTRSLWADEKVDIGHWRREGRLYATAKNVERALLRNADAVTVLTNEVRGYFRDEYPHRDEIRAGIRVIPTCADLATFTLDVPPDPSLAAELAGHTTLAYVGSMGGWYMPAEMVRFYLAWRRHVKNPRLLVVTRMDPRELRDPIATAGFGDEVVHRSATRDEVARYLRCADASICLIWPVFSKRASAATKLGEILGCGVPVVANSTGDMGRVLGGTNAGVVVDDMSDASLDAAAKRLAALVGREDVRREARRIATRWFSLEAAVDAYDRLYSDMPTTRGGGARLPDGVWPIDDVSPNEDTRNRREIANRALGEAPDR